MGNAPGRARSDMSTGHSTPRIGKFLHGALTIVVGILTFGAFICAVMFFSSGGYSADSLSVQTVSAGAIQDKIKLESQSVNTIHTGSSSNGSLSGAGDKASDGNSSGGAYNTGGSGNADSSNSSSDVASNGNDSSNSGSGGNTSVDNSGSGSGTGGNTSVDNNGTGSGTGGNSSVDNSGTGSGTESSGSSGNTTGSTSSTNSGSGSGSSNTVHRIPSACYGGVGHCFIGH